MWSHTQRFAHVQKDQFRRVFLEQGPAELKVWRTERAKVKLGERTVGESASDGVFITQLLGLFCLGEIIGRGNLVGYKY